MPDNLDTPEHLSQINTMMTVLGQARGEDGLAEEARRRLVVLYYGAAFRYILACLRNQEVAQDLAQQFALRLMEGNYVKNAKPGQGKRFRDYLKRSLQNLVIDFHRKKKDPQSLPEDSGAWNPKQEEVLASDSSFMESMRDELIAATWKRLAKLQEETNTAYETVLRLRTQNPNLRSAKIAEQLSQETGRPFSESGVRQLIHRGREKFAELLLQNVEQSLQTYDHESLTEALVDLQLLEYCRPALEKRQKT